MRFDLNQLNPAQREAVQTIDGPLLILAGAGTGKTRVIAYRAAWLTRSGIPPEQILAVTFTNKAAREMRERIAGLVAPAAAQAMTLCTFHAFGARLLHRHIASLGYSPRFAISSESYQIGLVRNLMGELGYSGEGWDPNLIRASISRAKNALLTPDDLAAQAVTPVDRAVGEVYALYQIRMRNMDLLDFDDLLVKLLELWQRFPAVLKAHQDQYRYLMVDEYQDTNPVQFQLVSQLAGKSANLGVVGDDDQSIYGWRGATIENILHFETHYPGAKVIRLEQNYRSTGIILEAANQVIANNPKRHPKQLWSGLERGEKIMTILAEDEEDEARLAAHIIEDFRLSRGSRFEEFAILYRSNHQSRLFEEMLRRYKIPYCLVGGHSFFERKEVLDAISLLQAAWNPRDDLALLRILNVPPRGLGDKAIEKLREWQRITTLPLQQILQDGDFLGNLAGAAAGAVRDFIAGLETHRKVFAENGSLGGKIRDFFKAIGYLDGLGRMYKPKEDALNRQENVMEFTHAADGFSAREGPAASLGDFLEKFALLDDSDREEKEGRDGNTVTLMTVHAAKGLEFPVVLIAGMEQGLFPHQQAVDEQRLEEERRLFYVALTRARQTLILTHAERRRVRGGSVRRRPSPFLIELPQDLVEIRSSADALNPASAEVADDCIAKMKAMFAVETKPGR